MYLTDIDKIRKVVSEAIPAGSVIPRHTDKGHFYEIVPLQRTVRSVTHKIGFIKDAGLMNFKLNRGMEALAEYKQVINADNLDDLIALAKKAPEQDFFDAGEVGRQIHEEREHYMRRWMDTGKRPESILEFHIHQFDEADKRGHEKNMQVVAGLRGVEKFITEYQYIPAFCELYVYDSKLDTAGTLDDLGTIRVIDDKGDPNCQHDIGVSKRGNASCIKCPYKSHRELVLVDIKSSNQFKDHYWIQVMLYYYMFYKLTKLRPKSVYIIKVSKEDGFYKPEKLKEIPYLIKVAKETISMHEHLEKVKKLRERETVKI
jgi:hypothetical protein